MIKDLAKRLLGHGVVIPRKTVSGYLEWSLIRDVITSLQINYVLDVGANRGQFARNLRKTGYSGQIFSFEPVRDEFASMAKRFERDTLWHGFAFALGSENGERTLNVVTESTEMSSFLNPSSTDAGIRRDQVEIKRLDSIFTDLLKGIREPHIFMKTDTEGYDLEVTKGAEGCIRDILSIQSELFVEPAFEVVPRSEQGLALYDRLGFRLLGLSEIARDSRLGNIVAFNCVFGRSPVRIR